MLRAFKSSRRQSSLPPSWASRKQKPSKARLSFLGCPGEDLNLHAFRHYHLKVARLPITPPGQMTTLFCGNFFFLRRLCCRSCGLRVGVAAALVDRYRAAHGALDVVRGLAADKVELGAARTRTAQDFYIIYHRRVERKDFLDPDARGDFSHGKHRTRLMTVLNGQYHAFERLLADVFSGKFFFVGLLLGFKLDDVLPDAHHVT